MMGTISTEPVGRLNCMHPLKGLTTARGEREIERRVGNL